MLYECLVGQPPFRRDTEAETLWAHMQERAAPRCAAMPKLDPVLRKALAKDRDERYATCGELIDAAAAALGLSRPARAAGVRCAGALPAAPACWPARARRSSARRSSLFSP